MTRPTTVIEMNGEKHILTFGLGFLEQLNNKYKIENQGFGVSAGLYSSLMELTMKNPVMVADFIKFGTMTNHNRPTDSEIEEWVLEQVDDPEQEEKLFADFLELWKKLPGAKRVSKAVKDEQKRLEEPSEEAKEQTSAKTTTKK